ncbi:MAG: LysR family transcriptional regulator substrate-binding protein [Nocardioides sp.]
MVAPTPFRLGFVTGATPDKWARIWRERRRDPLELVPTLQEGQEVLLRADHDERVDMALVRLPIDRTGLHCIPLYDEGPVVLAGRDHFVAAADGSVVLADLATEQLVLPHASGWTPDAEQLNWPEMSASEAVETVAAGTGIVLLPRSVARLHARKDVVEREVLDLPSTKIALAWLIDRDDERTQAFVGMVRGRSANSSRS